MSENEVETCLDNAAVYIDYMLKGLADGSLVVKEIKTGFPNLDEKAGGLYPGLYVLAAVPSLGKTTFALQMADQIAEQGNNVLFFTMEQSRHELVSKSLARMTNRIDLRTARSSLDIRKGDWNETVLKAAEQYKDKIADRVSIIECNFDHYVGFMRARIRDYISDTGTKPCVFVDYLQILQPVVTGEGGTKKDEIDRIVTELKRISKDFDLPVVAISSLNRSNYMTEFSFESLKDSGGIEYTADVVWGLQLACLDEPLFTESNYKNVQEKRKTIAHAKANHIRRIKLVCIKNRYGISNYSCAFDYYPEFDLFVQEPAHNSKANYSRGQARQRVI